MRKYLFKYYFPLVFVVSVAFFLQNETFFNQFVFVPFSRQKVRTRLIFSRHWNLRNEMGGDGKDATATDGDRVFLIQAILLFPLPLCF